VIGRGLRLVGVGAVVGIAAAIALTRLMASLLYNVEATDPGTLVNAVLVLLLAGALAAFIPARRASRTDPVSVLRES
jgi:ABC-type antimicrobial peptide transport system permease subunit